MHTKQVSNIILDDTAFRYAGELVHEFTKEPDVDDALIRKDHWANPAFEVVTGDSAR